MFKSPSLFRPSSFLPVLVYGSETWALAKADRNLLERTEMRMSMDYGNKEDWEGQDRRNMRKGRCRKQTLENERNETGIIRTGTSCREKEMKM